MIVPVDGHWLNLMTGKRFHENISNSNSENDSTSTCSSETMKPTETEEQPLPSRTPVACVARKSDTKADVENIEAVIETTNEAVIETANEAVIETANEATPTYEIPPVPSLVQCTINLENIPKEIETTSIASCKIQTNASLSKCEASTININTHSSRIATMNLEVSKLSTKNIIEHSKIMSLQHMDRLPTSNSHFPDIDNSSHEAARRGTLDTFIPPLKDYHGINNPFLDLFNISKKAVPSRKQNGRVKYQGNARLSLPLQFNTSMASLTRPVKRKLSEKDIVIGPNGEVKRRKFRKPRKFVQLQVCTKNPSNGYHVITIITYI